MINSYKDVSALYEARRKDRDVEIAQYNVVEQAIKGVHPPEYARLFTESDVRIQMRTLRSADDSLFKFLSDIPVNPIVDKKGKRDSDTQRDKAEKVERIAQSWYNNSARRGGVEFDGIRTKLDRYAVRFGDGCILVNPDRHRKLVYLEAIDPRFLYAPNGWTPYSPEPLDNAVLCVEMTLGEVKQRFARDDSKLLMAIANAFKPTSVGYGQTAPPVDDTRMVKVLVYRSTEQWLAVCLANNKDVKLTEIQKGEAGFPGVCGVVSFKQFGTDPLLIGQVGIEAALEKVANQQIQNTERINKATTIGPPLLLKDLIIGGYNEVNMQLMQGRTFQAQRLAPDSPGPLAQVMGQFLAMADRFNYDPQSNQGAGAAVSGKAINALQAGPRSLVTNILYAPYRPAFARVHDECLGMELAMWPNERKTAKGKNGRDDFELDYRPSTDLEGYKGCIKIEQARPEGYNTFLQEVQKMDAGLSDLLSVLERDPDVRNVQEAYRRIQAHQTSQFIKAAFEGLGAADPLTGLKLSAELSKRISDGKSRDEAIQEMLAEGLLEPPAPEELPGAAGGLPPELAAMLGGGGQPELPAPSLAEARGY